MRNSEFKNWLWISNIMMNAFSKQKVSSVLKKQLLDGEKKSQLHKIVFFSTLFFAINFQFVMFIVSLIQKDVDNYFLIISLLIIGLVAMCTLIFQIIDSFSKLKLLKSMLDTSEDGKNYYSHKSQEFLSEISRILDNKNNFPSEVQIHTEDIKENQQTLSQSSS